jgi:hypothetical protein
MGDRKNDGGKNQGFDNGVSDSWRARRERRDRRRAPRLPVCWGVDLRLPHWRSYRVAWTRNISLGGLACQLDHEPDVGELVDLTLCLPNGRSLQVTTHIRHVQWFEPTKTGKVLLDSLKRNARYEIGLEFARLDLGQRAIIEATLRELAMDYGQE